MLSTANITMQFGAKPLFENVSVKFGDGNRYGLIGANGCGKSTFMKILGRDLEQSSGEVMLDKTERLGKLRQDQFAYEDQRVLDVVMMGHAEMWEAMSERDAIYANPDASEEDYMRAADLEATFAEYDGYTAEARAGELLLGLGIAIELHHGHMSAVAPGFKLRVLLAQALFSNPDILLLDEPTNNLDINTIRWLEDVLNARNSTMVIISHDRHFLNSVCTHMADLDYGKITVYPGNYNDYMLASTQAREQQSADNAKAKEKVAELKAFVARFSANASKAKQATSRARQIDKIKIEDFKPSSRQYPFIRFEYDERDKLHRVAVEVQKMAKGYDRMLFSNVNFRIDAGEKVAIIGPNGIGKTTLLRCLAGDLAAGHRHHQMGGKSQARLLRAGPRRRFRRRQRDDGVDDRLARTERRRPGGARHAGPFAVLRRRREEAGESAVRRRERPHAVRQADAGQIQRAADGRADQPHGHGSHRVAQHRARPVQGHADLRQP